MLACLCSFLSKSITDLPHGFCLDARWNVSCLGGVNSVNNCQEERVSKAFRSELSCSRSLKRKSRLRMRVAVFARREKKNWSGYDRAGSHCGLTRRGPRSCPRRSAFSRSLRASEEIEMEMFPPRRVFWFQ
jgi:hypothetical protein